jgi:hypothetical protein
VSSDKRIIEYVRLSVKDDTPEPIINILAENISLVEDCVKRIKKEGSVVRDLKGNVIAHPSIKIKQDTDVIIANLIMKFKRTPDLVLDYDEDYYDE